MYLLGKKEEVKVQSLTLCTRRAQCWIAPRLVGFDAGNMVFIT